MMLLFMYQVFSSLLGHLHFFVHFFFTFKEQFFFDHPVCPLLRWLVPGSKKEIPIASMKLYLVEMCPNRAIQQLRQVQKRNPLVMYNLLYQKRVKYSIIKASYQQLSHTLTFGMVGTRRCQQAREANPKQRLTNFKSKDRKKSDG